MQKQVEVRMDENQLEPSVDGSESACGGLCGKVMKNMVLTLTILGTFALMSCRRCVITDRSNVAELSYDQ